jgi:hypothetical protein
VRKEMKINELNNTKDVTTSKNPNERNMSLEERAAKIISGEITRTPEEIALGRKLADQLVMDLYGPK